MHSTSTQMLFKLSIQRTCVLLTIKQSILMMLVVVMHNDDTDDVIPDWPTD